MLKDLTNVRMVKLQIEATDWEDAIRQAAQPLQDEQKIHQSYIDGMIENVKEAGPYIVITPHVALPHTRPNNNVFASAIGIATLKTPIAFGSMENDPVKYIFCLCATDNESHLSALADLANLLDDSSFYALLDASNNPQEVIDFLNK